jgi:catechol 2,3-dioxygenase-like lactoylglutathione lyase family enzyme
MAISFSRTIPILRIFSVEKAKEFYVGYLGFQVDWERKFEEVAPIYMQVARRTGTAPERTLRRWHTGLGDLCRDDWRGRVPS